MTTPALLYQLLAMRAQVDAMIHLLQGELPQVTDPEQCPSCGAGPEQQRNTSTLDGTQRRRCAVCQKEREL